MCDSSRNVRCKDACSIYKDDVAKQEVTLHTLYLLGGWILW